MTTLKKLRRESHFLPGCITAVLLIIGSLQYTHAQTISGNVINGSNWEDQYPQLNPPGDGNSFGYLRVGLWNADSQVEGPPVYMMTLDSGAMPLSHASYTYLLGTNLPDGSYDVVGWIDADEDGGYDFGEPRNLPAVAIIFQSDSVVAFNVTVVDDSDDDGMPDWWEVHWFHNLERNDDDDDDGDGLTNLKEFQIHDTLTNMFLINPANWDTDFDGMDDKWEYDHYVKSLQFGLNPTDYNPIEDIDGDGLSSWQEYCGVDGYPVMLFDAVIDGIIIKGKENIVEADDLNPLDVDTDFDLLLDSFEAAWYDITSEYVTNRIDPREGISSNMPSSSSSVDLGIATADSDKDGMSNYREQCLLMELRESGSNSFKWVWQEQTPFPYDDYYTDFDEHIRICLMQEWWYTNEPEKIQYPLDLNLNMFLTVTYLTNRTELRNEEWTDPTENTSYLIIDEDIPPGHDTDEDWLPDGWEVQFNLDPRDDGLSNPTNLWSNGAFGDPDGDGILNWDEYLGQDGVRYTTFQYINGNGDESNPYQYNWRPDSTYKWRWMPTNAPHQGMVDPRVGLGINRDETLGSALPTTSLGTDSGYDSDDDAIPDDQEIHPYLNPLNTNAVASSPVHSCSPFIPKSILITDPSGILIPDPEPASAEGFRPAGTRDDLQRKDWTIECQVKLVNTNVNGDLFRFTTQLGPVSRTVYKLSLQNGQPVLLSQNSNGSEFTITGNTLPTNRWIHLAGSWDHGNNSLSLYMQGVLYQQKAVFGECASALMFPATNTLALAVSPDSTFVNNLYLDEVRIWGMARSSELISEYANQLVIPALGDDMWIDDDTYVYTNQLRAFFHRSVDADAIMINGGSLFEGELGVYLDNVKVSFKIVPDTEKGTYVDGEDLWIDDGDNVFMADRDILLKNGGDLYEGELGANLAKLWDNQNAAQAVFADKDGNGVFNHGSLLAYYRFDDGGETAEDFAHPAQKSVLGVAREYYSFGDRGYALPTNNFQWVTNDAAPVLGVDAKGADDSDFDGMPDAWEIVMHLDPYDDGTGQETGDGLKNGPFGPRGDPDNDGLLNIYEFWGETNPRDYDTNGDGIPDSQEDLDGDGVVNNTEQSLGSRPDNMDTDDDGITDNEEQAGSTNPADPTDPHISKAMVFGGDATDYLEVPISVDQRMVDWTLEAWVYPADGTNGEGVIVKRVVQALGGGNEAINYILGLDSTGPNSLNIYAGYVLPNGDEYILTGGTIATGDWTHIGASYDNLTATLTLYTNGQEMTSSSSFYPEPPINGKGGETFLRIGENFRGKIDEVRIWDTVRTPNEVEEYYLEYIPYHENGLVHYFSFDDGEATTDTFPFGPYHQPHGAQDFTYEEDWNVQWRHAAITHGNVTFDTNSVAITPPPSIRVIILPTGSHLRRCPVVAGW